MTQNPLDHPAHVDRQTLRPIKDSGFVSIRHCGARLQSSTAVRIVRAANAPHSYLNKHCNGVLVPLWVALVFGCMRGSRTAEVTAVMLDVARQPDDWRASFATVFKLSGLDAAKAVLGQRRARWEP